MEDETQRDKTASGNLLYRDAAPLAESMARGNHLLIYGFKEGEESIMHQRKDRLPEV